VRLSRPLLKHIDQIALTVISGVAPVFVFSGAGGPRVIGTGFFARLDQRHYFVSAAHVLQDYGQENVGVILFGQPYSFADRQFFFSATDDLCFSPLDAELESVLKDNFKIPISRDLGPFKDGAHGVVFLGFPRSLNRSGMPTALPVSTTLESRSLLTMTRVDDPAIYWLNDPCLLDSDGDVRIEQLETDGMSGSPAFSWINIGTDEAPVLAFKMQSVVVEWEYYDGYIVGSKIGKLIQLIDANPH